VVIPFSVEPINPVITGIEPFIFGRTFFLNFFFDVSSY